MELFAMPKQKQKHQKSKNVSLYKKLASYCYILRNRKLNKLKKSAILKLLREVKLQGKSLPPQIGETHKCIQKSTTYLSRDLQAKISMVISVLGKGKM